MKPNRTFRFVGAGRSPAFTLTELLVAISIISFLLSVLLPAIGRARMQAKRAACRSQLHGVGMAMRMYVDDNANIMPVAAQLPTEEPNLPCITDVLLPYLKDPRAMRCPADTVDNYFEEQGTSYEYPHFLRGRHVDQTFLGKRWGETNTPVLFDFGPFHDRQGRPTAMNFLFGDGHVGILE